MLKRVLSFILALVMCLGMMPSAALAAGGAKPAREANVILPAEGAEAPETQEEGDAQELFDIIADPETPEVTEPAFVVTEEATEVTTANAPAMDFAANGEDLASITAEQLHGTYFSSTDVYYAGEAGQEDTIGTTGIAIPLYYRLKAPLSGGNDGQPYGCTHHGSHDIDVCGAGLTTACSVCGYCRIADVSLLLPTADKIADINSGTEDTFKMILGEIERVYNKSAYFTDVHQSNTPPGNGIDLTKFHVDLSRYYAARQAIMAIDAGVSQPKTTSGTYEIANAGDLLWFAALVNSGSSTLNARLTADIDLSGVSWLPIGTQPMAGSGMPGAAFNGTFDGNGYVIRGLTIDSTDGYAHTFYQGLFGWVGAGGTVRKVILEDVSISLTGVNNIGGICGKNDGTIADCAVIGKTGHAVLSGSYCGGICGRNESGGSIQRCISAYAVVKKGNNNGGICGKNDGTMDYCYYDNKVSTSEIKAYGSSSNGTFTNANAAGYTTDEFKTGEIAAALGWGQVLNGYAGEATQTYPVPGGQAVYSDGAGGYSNIDLAHEHDKDANGNYVWASDATYHWYECLGDGCPLRASDAVGKFIIDANDAVVSGTEAHTGTTGYDNTRHWSECSVCHRAQTAVDHTWAYTPANTTETATITAGCSGCDIAGRTLTITAPASPVYNGGTHPVVVDTTAWNSVADYTIKYTRSGVTDDTEAVTTAAGTVTATVTVGTVSAGVTYTVAKAAADTLIIDASAVTDDKVPMGTTPQLKAKVNGTEVSAVWSVTDGDTYASVSGTGGLTILSVPTDGSTVTVTATRPSADANYEDAVAVYTFTPVKGSQAGFAITGKPAGDIAFGSGFALGTTGGAGTGAVTWTSSDDSIATVSGGTVAVTGVGTVTITAQKAGDDDYEASAAAEYTFTSVKATPTVTNVTCTAPGVIYPSTAAADVTLTCTPSVAGTIALKGAPHFTVGTADYDWIFTPDDAGHYNTVEGTVSLTVAENPLVDLEMAGTATTAYHYGDSFSLEGLTFTARYQNNDTKDVTNLVSVTPAKLTMGVTQVTVSYTSEGVTKGHVVPVTVAKKPITVTGVSWTDGRTVTVYDGQTRGLTLTGDLPAGVTVTKTDDTAKNAGSYTATAVFALAGTGEYTADNYELTCAPLTEEWSIGRRPVTVTPNAVSVTFGGTPSLTYIAEGLVGGESLSGAPAVLGTDVGEHDITRGTLTNDNNPNYDITFTEGVKLTVTRAEQPALTVSGPSPARIAYKSTAALSAAGGAGGTVRWAVISGGSYATVDADTGVVTVTAVPTDGSTVTVRATMAGGANFNDVTADYTFTPVRARVNPGAVYYENGPIFTSTSKAEVESKLKIPNATPAGHLTLAVGAGGFTVGSKQYTWTFTPDDGFYEPATGFVTLDVQRNALTSISVTSGTPKLDYTFGDSFSMADIVVTAVYANGDTADVTADVTVAPARLTMGVTGVTLGYTTADGDNARCTVTGITVARREISVAHMQWADERASDVYNGQTQGLTLTGTIPAGVKVAKSGHEKIDAGSYAASAVFTLTGQGDYTAENYVITGQPQPEPWHISPCAVTVVPDAGQEKTYGEDDPVLTYTASPVSLFGTDKLSGALGREPGDDVGEYKITQGTLAAPNGNYTIDFTSDVVFTVTKAKQVDFVIPGAEGDGTTLTDEVVYGESFVLTVSGGAPDGTVTWDVTGPANVAAVATLSRGVAASSVLVTITGVGTVTVTAVNDGGEDYAPKTLTWIFTAQPAVPDIGAVTYTGPAIYPSTAAASVALTREKTDIPGALALVGAVFTEAGTAIYDWSFTPEDGVNYTTLEGTIQLTVSKNALAELRVSGTPGKTVYADGDTFDTTGLTVTAVFANGDETDVTAYVTSEALRSGQMDVLLAYTSDGVTKTCTVSGIDVGYRVTVRQAAGGQATASAGSAVRGSRVTLTVTAADGYRHVGWLVEPATVMVTDGSFTMPGENVTVTPLFEHTHSWDSVWSANASGHWHVCVSPGCTISDISHMDGFAAHTYTGGDDLTCDVCGYERQAEAATEFSVTLDAVGGEVTPASVNTKNGKVVTLPTPVRAGFIFAGWFTAAEGGDQVTAGSAFTADATVYARWTVAPGGNDEPIIPDAPDAAPKPGKPGFILPHTGDDAVIGPWVVLAVFMCLAAACALVMWRRGRGRRMGLEGLDDIEDFDDIE